MKSEGNIKILYETETELQIFELENCSMEDGGKYTVKASNEHGTASATFNVIVKELKKPKKKSPVKETQNESETTEEISITESTHVETTSVKSTVTQMVKISQLDIKVVSEKPRWSRRGKTTPQIEAAPEVKPVKLGEDVRVEVKVTGQIKVMHGVNVWHDEDANFLLDVSSPEDALIVDMLILVGMLVLRNNDSVVVMLDAELGAWNALTDTCLLDTTICTATISAVTHAAFIFIPFQLFQCFCSSS